MSVHDYIPILEAAAIAARSGVQCELVHVMVRQEEEMLISIATTDSAPTVAVIEQGKPGSMLLSKREETGPDRWDYPLHREGCRDQLAMYLSAGSRSALVVCAPVAVGHLVRFGWRDMTGDPIPIVVSKATVSSAIQSVLTPVSDGRLKADAYGLS